MTLLKLILRSKLQYLTACKHKKKVAISELLVILNRVYTLGNYRGGNYGD